MLNITQMMLDESTFNTTQSVALSVVEERIEQLEQMLKDNRRPASIGMCILSIR
jgi:hypothetical protein